MADNEQDNGQFDVRRQVLDVLLDKIYADAYPSVTMLDLVESLLTPDDVPDYAAVLVDKIRGDLYPSIDMMRRAVALG